MSKEKATEITNRLENLTWEEGLREQGLFNPEKAQGKPCQGIGTPDGDNKEGGARLLSAVPHRSTTGNGYKLKYRKFLVNKRLLSFSITTAVKQWNRFIKRLESPSWEILENSLAMVLSNLLQLTLFGGQATGLDCLQRSFLTFWLSFSPFSYSVDSEQKQCALHIISVSYMFLCNNPTIAFP